MTENPKDRIIVALDVSSLKEAGALIELLTPHVGCFKVGRELMGAVGEPQAIEFVHSRGGKVFCDAKLIDIPNTIAGAARETAKRGVRMFNLMCLGGRAMMEAARKAVDGTVPNKEDRPLILGVTLLTSLNYNDLVELGIAEQLNIADEKELATCQADVINDFVVRHLAWLAQDCGLDGVIASAKEAKAIREYCQPEFLIVTPGIRPVWSAAGDQKRITTPRDAILAGADMLVIGRPITNPPLCIGTSLDAVHLISHEIKSALAELETLKTKEV